MLAKQFRSNYALLLLLIIAFISLQWTSEHIHLAEHHDHDGAVHQHQIQVHTHSLTLAQNSGLVDELHQKNHINIIEFDHQYNVQQGVSLAKASAVAIIRLSNNITALSHSTKPILAYHSNTQQVYCNYSCLNPRGPPQVS